MENTNLSSLNNLISNYKNSNDKLNSLNKIGSILQEHGELSEKIAGVFFDHVMSEKTEENEKTYINNIIDKNIRLKNSIEIIKAVKNNDIKQLNFLLSDYKGKIEDLIIEIEPPIENNNQQSQKIRLLDYALSTNQDSAKVLISKLGHSIDLQDKAGNTLLMTCLLNGKEDLAKFLIQKGANSTLNNQKGLSPLSFSIAMDKKEIFDEIFKPRIKLQLPNSNLLNFCIEKRKYNYLPLLTKYTNALDLPSSNNMTPLITAISLEDHPAMKILLGAGANPETECDGKIAIDYALKKSPETLEILITTANESKNENAIIYQRIRHLKAHKPENYKEQLEVFNKLFSFQIDTYKEVSSRKLVSHSSSLAGTSEFESVNDQLSFKLEGFAGPRPFYRKTSELLHQEIQKGGTSPIKKEKLTNYMNIFYKGAEELTPEKIEMIKKGEDVIIAGGFKGHSISFLITTPDKNSNIRHLIICNRGAGMFDTPIDIYKFDVNNLNEGIIKSFQKAKEGDGVHYVNSFIPYLDKTLGLIKGDFEDQLSQLCKIDKQTVGNCTLANTEAALLALMVYDTIRSEFGFKNDLNNFKPRLKEVNDYYNDLVASSHIDYLNRYVQKHYKNDLRHKMDYQLVFRSLSNFYCLRNVYKKNIGKLNAIEKTLLKIMEKNEKENLKTCKVYFTNENEIVEYCQKFEKNKYYNELKDLSHDILFFYKTVSSTLNKYDTSKKYQQEFSLEIKKLLNEIEKIPTYFWQEKAVKGARSQLEQLNEKYRKIITTLSPEKVSFDI